MTTSTHIPADELMLNILDAQREGQAAALRQLYALAGYTHLPDDYTGELRPLEHTGLPVLLAHFDSMRVPTGDHVKWMRAEGLVAEIQDSGRAIEALTLSLSLVRAELLKRELAGIE